jgi:hypothetical protein
MRGVDRPIRTPSDRRRRNVVIFLVTSAAASADAVARMAQKLNVGERTIRLDLDAIREEIESPSMDELPRDLLEAIQSAETFRLLKALGERVRVEMVQGTISRELGQALTDSLREQRHTLRAMRDEQGHGALKALEVLTPQELEVLRAYRESLVPRGLKPGEFPPPPKDAPPQDAPKDAEDSSGSLAVADPAAEPTAEPPQQEKPEGSEPEEGSTS